MSKRVNASDPVVFVPAFLRGFSPHVAGEHTLVEISGPKFLIGRSVEADLCLRDTNISRNQCVFTFEDGSWTLTDLSFNGVTVNKIRVTKNQEVKVFHQDKICLSEQNKFHWTFNLGTPGPDDATGSGPPQKKQRVGVEDQAVSDERKRLRESLKKRKKIAEVRILREKLALEDMVKKRDQRLAEILADRDMLVSRLEAQVKKQAAKDREAREALQRETQGKVDREEIIKEFEQKLSLEREKSEEKNKALIENMESKIKSEENLRNLEKIERDEQLSKLNNEKNVMEVKFSNEKKEMERNLKDLQRRLEEENLSKEALDQEWQSQVRSMNIKMEEKLKVEKEEMEKAVMKEKEQTDHIKNEMEMEIELKAGELKRIEDELEVERAAHAFELEMLKEEKARQDEENKKQEERLKWQEEEMKAKQEELEMKIKRLEEANAGAGQLSEAVEGTLERELKCPTCLDLFICPVALSCGHTYCWLCLAQWKNTNGRTRGDLGTCPQCREAVKHENRVYAMENTINSLMEKLGPEKMKERQDKIAERKAEEEKFKKVATAAAINTAMPPASTPTQGERRPPQGQPRTRGRGGGVRTRGGGRGGSHQPPPPPPPIQISDDDSSEDSEDSDDPEDLFGFGSCFRCGRRGHWIRECPY